MQTIINEFAGFIREHIQSISVGLIATFLMVYGYKINAVFRKQTKSLNFFIRYCLFVLLCSVGYGFVSSQAAKWIKTLLIGLSNSHLIMVVGGAFLIMAFLAKKGKEI